MFSAALRNFHTGPSPWSSRIAVPLPLLVSLYYSIKRDPSPRTDFYTSDPHFTSAFQIADSLLQNCKIMSDEKAYDYDQSRIRFSSVGSYLSIIRDVFEVTCEALPKFFDIIENSLNYFPRRNLPVTDWTLFGSVLLFIDFTCLWFAFSELRVSGLHTLYIICTICSPHPTIECLKKIKKNCVLSIVLLCE